ncbi:Acylase OS=Streptomyces alboniger OX=132473 GN=CP975_32690 PE=3 SV=1 [Streptomyces alboniger]
MCVAHREVAGAEPAVAKADPACRGAAWVRPVTSLDVAVRSFAFAVLGGQGRAVDGITAAQPPTSATAPTPAPDARDTARAARELLAADSADMGSNAVAFSGTTTANGRGLLLGNPHYPWQGGRRFWQSQQTIPGELNVAGGSLLGSPTVSIGHNAHVAWSHTVATGAPLNLHQLALDPADPTAYLVDGRPERMTKRTVTVEVKDGAPVTRTQWWTRYGPVVTALGSSLPLPWTSTTAYALGDPNAANLRSLRHLAPASAGPAARPPCWRSAAAPRRVCPAGQHDRRRLGRPHLFTQSQVLPGSPTSWRSAARLPWARPPIPRRGSRSSTGRAATARSAATPTPFSRGIFGRARMPVLEGRARTRRTRTTAPGWPTWTVR